jgi:hypothetical protein
VGATGCADENGLPVNLSYDRCMEAFPSEYELSFAPRKLSRGEAKLEQRLYWSGKSIPERLAAATELTRRLYRMRGIDIDEHEADFTPRRVRRS